MGTDIIKEMIYDSSSPDETYKIAYEMGTRVTPGTVLAMSGDLGAGKTLFTQGLAAGLGIGEPVVSPTFTILQIYETGRIPLYHFDVYRIEEPDEMQEVGLDDFLFGRGVSVIEWAPYIRELLPEKYTDIRITRNPERGPDYRRIEISEIV